MKERLTRHWPTLLLLLLPIIPLWRCVFLGEAIGPWDQILAMSPWDQTPKPGRSWDVLSADGVLQFHVWREMVFQGWRTFDPPFWNPHQLMGTPILANSQSGAFYPPHIIAAFTYLPTAALIVILAWLHLAWAGLGVRRFVLNMGGSEHGAFFAGASFAVSAFMLGWTPLASVITTCSWIPWCLAWVVELVKGDRPRNAGGKLAFGIGMMLLSGHLQFSAYGMMAVLLLGLALVFTEKRLPRLGWGVAAIVLGGLMAAPQLVPVLQYSQFSHRRAAPTMEGYQAYVGGRIEPFEFLGLGYAAATGFPGTEGATLEDGTVYPGYWPAYVRRGAAFAEGAMAFGPMVLILAVLFSIRRRFREALPLNLVGFVGLLLAAGTPLNQLLYFTVPGWAATGSPGRAISLFVLWGCVAAGLVWPKQDEDAKPKPLWGGVAAIFAATVIGIQLAAGNLGSWIPNFAPAPFITGALTSGLPTIILSTICAAAAIWFWKEKRASQALISAVLAQVLTAAPWTVLSAKADIPARNFDPNARYAFINQGWDLLTRQHALMPPNVASISGINDIAGYDSLLHRDTVAVLNDINGQDSAPPANGNIMHIKPGFDPVKLAEAGVSRVYSNRPRDGYAGGGDGIFENDRLFFAELQTQGRAYTPQGQASITFDGFSRQMITATGPGELIVKDRHMPGWEAFVDGQKAEIKPGTFRAVDLTEGEHQIEFRYTPPGLHLGGLLGLAGWLGMALFLILNRARRETNAEHLAEVVVESEEAIN